MKSIIVGFEILSSIRQFIGVPDVKLFLLEFHFHFVVSFGVFITSNLQKSMILIHLSLMMLELFLKSNQLFSVQSCLFRLLPKSLQLFILKQSFGWIWISFIGFWSSTKSVRQH